MQAAEHGAETKIRTGDPLADSEYFELHQDTFLCASYYREAPREGGDAEDAPKRPAEAEAARPVLPEEVVELLAGPPGEAVVGPCAEEPRVREARPLKVDVPRLWGGRARCDGDGPLRGRVVARFARCGRLAAAVAASLPLRALRAGK